MESQRLHFNHSCQPEKSYNKTNHVKHERNLSVSKDSLHLVKNRKEVLPQFRFIPLPLNSSTSKHDSPKLSFSTLITMSPNSFVEEKKKAYKSNKTAFFEVFEQESFSYRAEIEREIAHFGTSVGKKPMAIRVVG
ncbi:hypothetical protein AVEN_146272-1 [Araneus ventricosus]|uniref:Uncharacterized protein n=1 Tax=Araneus ventricosus TaxID=182803 RepID=A0A4Y2VBE8_ARAVE|nr:hypothetical protein AVEN_146272-1 [Araneus ventricosus]